MLDLKILKYLLSVVDKEMHSTLTSSANTKYVEYVLDGLSRANVSALTIFSESYPNSLKEIPHPPIVLYYKGDIALLKSKAFGNKTTERWKKYGISGVEKFVDRT